MQKSTHLFTNKINKNIYITINKIVCDASTNYLPLGVYKIVASQIE